MGGGGAPIGEARPHREASLENGSEVGWESEVEGGFDGRDFGVSKARGDGDVGMEEVVDEVFGVGGEREAYPFWFNGLLMMLNCGGCCSGRRH